MLFIIGLAIAIIGFKLMFGDLEQPPKVEHKLHSWTYDENEKLYCSVCNQRPGLVETKNGEY